MMFALCLAANVVIFSVVDPVLIQPLPFPEADQLVMIYNHYTKFGGGPAKSSVPSYFEHRDNVKSLSEVAALENSTALVGGSGTPDRAWTSVVTPSFFRVLRTQPALGRLFLEADGAEGKTGVVVLSDSYWRAHFNADPAVIGRMIQLDGEPVTIVGVLPRSFRYIYYGIQIWRPLAFSAADREAKNRHSNFIETIGRLRPGVSVSQAQAEIDALNAHLAATDPKAAWAAASGFHSVVINLHAHQVGGVRPLLLLLQAGVWLLMLVGLANIVNLLLVRANSRAKELAVRQALGASRGDLTLGFVGETTLLATLGGLLGLALAAAALPVISRWGLNQLEFGVPVTLGFRVVVIALGVSVALGILLAGPLLAFHRYTDFARSLASDSRSSTASRGTSRLRNLLTVTQIALAFVLLTGASLLGVSFRNMLAIQPGFRAENSMAMWVGLTPVAYSDGAVRFHFAQRWIEALRDVPGVESVGLSTSLPLMKGIWNQAVRVEGASDGANARAHNCAQVMGGYFAALGIPLREGRLLAPGDSQPGPRPCVVDEAFARRYWPGGGAIGRHIGLGTDDPLGRDGVTIVGIVGGVKQNGLTENDPKGTVYFPMRADAVPAWIPTVVRSTRSLEELLPSIRKTLRELDPALPLDDVRTLASWVEQNTQVSRSLMMMSTLFAVIALLLAAVGVYGMMAYTVSQRRKEIGIRMALGAVPAQIMRHFLRMGGTLLVIGTLVGAAGTWFTARALGAVLYGVVPTEALVYVGAAMGISTVVMLACLVPSRRAAAVPVAEALRRD